MVRLVSGHSFMSHLLYNINYKLYYTSSHKSATLYVRLQTKKLVKHTLLGENFRLSSFQHVRLKLKKLHFNVLHFHVKRCIQYLNIHYLNWMTRNKRKQFVLRMPLYWNFSISSHFPNFLLRP